MNNPRPVGQTAAAGFQVGVRRTFPIPVLEAWKLITSPKGLSIWLGEGGPIDVEVGQLFQTEEGISGEFRVVNELENLRLSWTAEHWAKSSTLQIRTIPAGDHKTTISFHQEKLSGPDVREAMKRRWEDVLGRLQGICEEA
ncbi:SRPBCC family protein [Paenibacillus zeisoli]|uniref:SRPBCC family protein n=1 Tax=Paenibacillus zeisoli TaxID=2496267 RepID=UPI001FECED28|nr:SRPBCC domain-containing protein [Paenibacillus zeisoli]